MEQIVPTLPLGHDLDGLGQGLYEPPGAKGWAGGRAWINAATMLARNNLAWAILSGSGRYGETVDPAAVAGKHGSCDCRRGPPVLRRPSAARRHGACGGCQRPDAKDALRRAAYQ